MLKKTIRFTDLNGNPAEEDHFFHLTKADLVELEMSKKGGMAAWIQRIVDSEDGAEIMAEFKKLLLLAYGKKSSDGKRFIKTEEMRQEFLSSEAYSELFMELVTDAEAAAAFVNGLVPFEVAKDMPKTVGDLAAPNLRREPRVLTRAELTEIDTDELKHLLATGQAVIGQEG